MRQAQRFNFVLLFAVCLTVAGCGGGAATRSAPAVPLVPESGVRSTDATGTAAIQPAARVMTTDVGTSVSMR